MPPKLVSEAEQNRLFAIVANGGPYLLTDEKYKVFEALFSTFHYDADSELKVNEQLSPLVEQLEPTALGILRSEASNRKSNGFSLTTALTDNRWLIDRLAAAGKFGAGCQSYEDLRGTNLSVDRTSTAYLRLKINGHAVDIGSLGIDCASVKLILLELAPRCLTVVDNAPMRSVKVVAGRYKELFELLAKGSANPNRTAAECKPLFVLIHLDHPIPDLPDVTLDALSHTWDELNTVSPRKGNLTFNHFPDLKPRHGATELLFRSLTGFYIAGKEWTSANPSPTANSPAELVKVLVTTAILQVWSAATIGRVLELWRQRAGHDGIGDSEQGWLALALRAHKTRNQALRSLNGTDYNRIECISFRELRILSRVCLQHNVSTPSVVQLVAGGIATEEDVQFLILVAKGLPGRTKSEFESILRGVGKSGGPGRKIG